MPFNQSGQTLFKHLGYSIGGLFRRKENGAVRYELILCTAGWPGSPASSGMETFPWALRPLVPHGLIPDLGSLETRCVCLKHHLKFVVFFSLKSHVSGSICHHPNSSTSWSRSHSSRPLSPKVYQKFQLYKNIVTFTGPS